MDNFEIILNSALRSVEGYINGNGLFYDIYPFTTERISGYISKFNLNNKSLLTLGSSCDQVINAILFNCNDITLLDICPYTKFYFYLINYNNKCNK